MNTKKIRFPRIINSMFRKVSLLTLLAFALLLSPLVAYGATVTLAWDANTETDLAGYKIYYGTVSRTASGDYSHTTDVGNTTQYTIADLEDGVTYYLAATAYDEDENESAYSEELVHTTNNPNHTITASADTNGSISPAGSVTVNHGSSRTFTISADANYHVQDVLVDGVSVGAVTSYTFTNVIQNRTVQASFAINTHTITATAGANGSISPSGNVTVNHGSSRTFTISASTNYHVQDVLVDGVSVGAVSSYTFANVTQNHTIQASFAINTHTITATAGANGSISPAGSVTVNHGSSRTFTISASANYHVQDVLVNGVSVGAVSSYTFTNVIQNHMVHVIFAGDEHPPVANAGADQAVYVNDTVQLDGSASSDMDGNSLTFEWSFISKPGGSSAALSDTQAVKPVFDVDVAGTYTVQLIVNDGTVNSAPDTVTISTENSAPVANAGADQAVYVNDTVQLDGSASSDVDGNSLTFTWSFISKPSGSSAALSDTQAVKPVFDVDVSGTYTVQLVVNDGTVNSAPDTVTISTENSAPVANAGADQAVRVNDTVHLDGSASSDVDGNSLTFTWSFISKPSGSSAALSDTQAVKPVFDVDVAGTYTVQLIINDGTVNSTPDTVTISTENSAPVANAGADQAVRVNDTVHLDGSASSDVDGNSLTFTWSFISKPGGSSAALSDTQAVKPVFDVDVAGTYTVQLIVNDGTVNSAPDTVTISTENSAPVANAGADQAVRVNDTVHLDGSASSDVDGNSLTFTWSFISKPGGSSAALSDTQAVKPVFDVDVSGTYTVQLIVNDGTVNSAPDTVAISTENSTPVANAGADQAVYVNDTVQLDGSASSDVDGNSLTFTWSFISKPSGSSAALSDTQAVKPVFDVDVSGTYTVQLVVNDGTVNSAPDTVTISTENSAPVANAGADQAVRVNDTVHLDGSASSDVDGNSLTFTWSFISKPGGSSAALSDTQAVKPVFDVDVAGTYTVQLIVNDGTVNSAPDTVAISTENSTPVANAGADQAVYVNDTVQLDGSASSDVDGNSLTFTWSFISKPGGSSAALSDTQAVKPVFDVDVSGTYTVQLIVNDGTVNSAPDTVTISTENSAPVANAGADQAVRVNDTVHLDGSASSDVDGNSLTFTWSFISKPSGSSAALSDTQAMKPVFDVDVAGTYTVQLIVNDGTVNSTPDTVTISTENSAPVANAGADQAVRVNDTVHLDGSASSDVDGNSLTFTWSFISKPGGSSAALYDTQAVKPVFDVDVAGTYTVQLIVNDGTVNSTPDTVTISTENSAPVANAGADQAVRVNDTVQLDGSASSDVDGNSLTFAWSFISKPSGSSAALSDTQAVKPVFDVDVSGTYTVQLIVNDGTVNSAPDTVTISTENSAPVANAGGDQSVLINDTVQLDGSGSSDVDGDILTFEWSIVSKPGGSSAVLSDTNVVKPVFDVDVAGIYTVQLIVNDGTVNSAPDTVTISTENSAPVANAGGDQSVLINDTVQLDGSGSSDVDGDILTFKWSIVSKPGGSSAVLSDTQAVKPVFDVDVAGNYTVQLIVNDGTVNSAPDTVTISTENSAPVSRAGADQAVLVNDTVQLDGSASSDVDGDTLTFTWSLVSKPGGSNTTLSNTTVVKPTVDVDIAGTYSLQLIVNDGTVNSAPDTVTISTENSAPVSRAGTDQAVLVNDTVQLDGSTSSDADGDTLTFKWSFISKPGGSIAVLSSKTTAKPTFKVDDAGTYIVQLIVNDGTDNSKPDTVTLITENSAPVSNAGDDQTVEEGETVTLSGLNSTDPDDNIASYTWQQTGGKSVILSNSKGAETTFTAPNAVTDADILTFRLTVKDAEGLQDIDDCIATVTRVAAVDSDGDGVPDGQDAFPNDPNEYLDTDGDGQGNNADTDDDNDGMPDTWEVTYGLDPLKDDAADDPDGDEISNINEYNLGSDPNYNESNFAPDPPQLLNPGNDEIVGLTPLLETDEFYDPDINDVHSQTRWNIIRAEDDFIVFDVTTNSSLTVLKVPKLILEEGIDYIWQVKFIDNQGTASEWSEAGYFTTKFLEQDSDGNGVLDFQEVDTTIDLDNDGIMDRDQEDIKCVATETGDFKVGISIREAENADSIVSIQSETPSDTDLLLSAQDGLNFLAFGLIHFKLLVKEPGDEVLVTIYLSKAAYDDGIWYKYDPVNDEWFDYSDFIDFSADRKTVHLTLTDGGFGDADGIENGIIVDPLALRTATDHSSGSDSFVEDIAKNLDPSGMCFISAADSRSADRQPLSFWREIRNRELLIVFILMMLAYIGKEIFLRIKQYRRPGRKTSLMEGWKNS